MKPKKAKDLIPIVVKETGHSSMIVETVVNFYWREIWEHLTQLTSPKIHIENLGDFNIKHWILDKELEKRRHYLNNRFLNKMNYATIVKLEKSISLMENVKLMLDEENQRKEFVYEYKRNKTDLGKQEGYYPGDIL